MKSCEPGLDDPFLPHFQARGEVVGWEDRTGERSGPAWCHDSSGKVPTMPHPLLKHQANGRQMGKEMGDREGALQCREARSGQVAAAESRAGWQPSGSLQCHPLGCQGLLLTEPSPQVLGIWVLMMLARGLIAQNMTSVQSNSSVTLGDHPAQHRSCEVLSTKIL